MKSVCSFGPLTFKFDKAIPYDNFLKSTCDMELSDTRKYMPDMTWTFKLTLDYFKIDMEIEQITTGDIATPTPSLKVLLSTQLASHPPARSPLTPMSDKYSILRGGVVVNQANMAASCN